MTLPITEQSVDDASPAARHSMIRDLAPRAAINADVLPVAPGYRRATRAELRNRYLSITGERFMEQVQNVLPAEKLGIVSEFIVNHMLMPQDREARDGALEVLYDKMKRVQVMGLAKNLGESVELAQLAKSLDDSLVDILDSRGYRTASLVDSMEIDSATLEENRSAERLRQVELLCNNLRFFHQMTHTRLAKFAVPSMKLTARAIGVAPLVDQIDIGYQAARAIDDVDVLANALYAHERERLANLFATRS